MQQPPGAVVSFYVARFNAQKAAWGKPHALVSLTFPFTNADLTEVETQAVKKLKLPKREAKRLKLFVTETGLPFGGFGEYECPPVVHLSATFEDGFEPPPDLIGEEIVRLAELVAATKALQAKAAAAAEQAEQERTAVKELTPVLFWRDGDSHGYLSNWQKATFSLGGVTFSCVEQYYMWMKATLFEDAAAAKAIMGTGNCTKMKKFGREVRGFKPGVWKRHQPGVLLEGSRAKFAAHPHLAERLLATNHRRIAEASPSDVICGIGMGPDDPRAADPSNWHGENLLGKALEQIRTELQGGQQLHRTCSGSSCPALAADGEPQADETSSAGIGVAPVNRGARVGARGGEGAAGARVDGGAGTPTTLVKLISYGRRNGTPPNLTASFNCTNIANPSKTSRAGRTGLDKRLRTEVMAGRLAQDIAARACDSVLEAVKASVANPATMQFGFGCEVGKHRSVSVAITVANELQQNQDLVGLGVQVATLHRDIA